MIEFVTASEANVLKVQYYCVLVLRTAKLALMLAALFVHMLYDLATTSLRLAGPDASNGYH
jgi:hypothetical protein